MLTTSILGGRFRHGHKELLFKTHITFFCGEHNLAGLLSGFKPREAHSHVEVMRQPLYL